MRPLLLLFALLGAFLFPAAGSAASSLDDRFQLRAERADDGGALLAWDIAPGAYLYRDKVAVSGGTPSRSLPASLSAGERKDDPGFGMVEIWRGRGEALVPAAALQAAGSPTVLTVTYQGCEEDSICYPPVTKTVDVGGSALSVATHEGGSSTVLQTAGKASPSEAQRPAQADPVLQVEAGPEGGLVGRLAAEGGAAWVILAFAGFGALLAFTPCVLPMYPILAGLLARDGARLSPRRGVALASTYVLAMASAFALLGIVAAWSGANLQAALQSPYAVGLLSLVFVALALSMFGLFELQLPQGWVAFLSRRSASAGRPSLASAGVLGFTSALIVGPCVTAPLAGGLLYIAQSGDLALGAAALFALGLGKGAPLVVMGALGPRALPRAGPWMERIKQLFGALFLAAALWLASRILSPSLTLGLAGALLIAAAVYLRAFDHLPRTAGAVGRAAKTAGVLAGLWGALLLAGAATGADDPLRPLHRLGAPSATAAPAPAAFAEVRTLAEAESAVSAAAAAGQPTVVYFTADWCLSCDVIERNVFQRPDVQAQLAGVRLVKADVTSNNADAQALMHRFAAAGPPTMVFVDRDAQEVGEARLVGDVGADRFLDSLSKIKEGEA